MFTDMAGRVTMPVTLLLDHCPGPAVAKTCLEAGWNSVLFDGSGLSYEEGDLLPIEKEIEFIRESGIYCYAPPIGTAHGFYKAAPTIRYDRLQQ